MEICTLEEIYTQLRIDPETTTPAIDSLLLTYRDAATDKVAGAIGCDDMEFEHLLSTRSGRTVKTAVLAIVGWLFENRELCTDDFPEANLYCLIGHLKKL